jgi:hypothetical protein
VKPEKNNRKEIKVSEGVHGLSTKEAKAFRLSLKAYTEAALMFFISRKLNPLGIKEGEEYKILDTFHKGIDRIIRIIIRQEKDMIVPILENMKGTLHEQVNARVLTEVVINNLHRLSDLDREGLQQIIRENSEYAQKRKQDIMKVYHQKIDKK